MPNIIHLSYVYAVISSSDNYSKQWRQHADRPNTGMTI